MAPFLDRLFRKQEEILVTAKLFLRKGKIVPVQVTTEDSTTVRLPISMLNRHKQLLLDQEKLEEDILHWLTTTDQPKKVLKERPITLAK